MNLVRDSREKMSFEDALEQSFNGDRRDHDWMWDLYWGSLYSDAVLAYMHAFKKVKVISFEDLKNNPQAVVDDICRFLGASCSLKIDHDRKLSGSGVPKNLFVKALLSRNSSILVFLRDWLKTRFPRPILDYIVQHLLENIYHSKMMNRQSFENDWARCKRIFTKIDESYDSRLSLVRLKENLCFSRITINT